MTYLDYKEKEALRKQIAIRHLENGVEFVDINTSDLV